MAPTAAWERVANLTRDAWDLYRVDLVGLTVSEKAIKSLDAFNRGVLPALFSLEFRDLSYFVEGREVPRS